MHMGPWARRSDRTLMLCAFWVPRSPSLGPGGTTSKKRSGLLHLPKAGTHPAQGFSSRGQSACPQHQNGQGPSRSRLGGWEVAKLSKGALGPSPARGFPASNQGLNPLLLRLREAPPERMFGNMALHGRPGAGVWWEPGSCPLPLPHIPSTRVSQGQLQPEGPSRHPEPISQPSAHLPAAIPRGGWEGSIVTAWGLTSLNLLPSLHPPGSPRGFLDLRPALAGDPECSVTAPRCLSWLLARPGLWRTPVLPHRHPLR